MSRPGPSAAWRATSAAATATMIVGPGALGHVAAGGSLPAAPAVATWAALAALAAALGPRLRWTFARLTVVALLAQPVLHAVFGLGHGGHAGLDAHAAHAVHAHPPGGHLGAPGALTAGPSGHAAAHGSVAHGSVWMAIAHVVAAFAIAAILRWGVRWVRSMPTLARALVVAGRGRVAPVPRRPLWFAVAPVAVRPVPVAVVGGCGTRGPPC